MQRRGRRPLLPGCPPFAGLNISSASLPASTHRSHASKIREIFYTGLDRKEVPVLVTAGEVLERNIELTSADRYGANGPAITLNPYVITAGKEREGEALATNEQRFAPNIKTVVATDTLGNIV